MATANATLGNIVNRLRHAALASCEAGDRELLQRYITLRDESAFAILVKRYGPTVLGVCGRILRHRQDAEDVFQAVFLVLARKAAAIRQRESLAGWLHRVAYRAAMKLRRARTRRGNNCLTLFDAPEESRCEDLTLWETQQVLEEELQRLADKYRAPLLLCCMQGRTRDEAARQLGWSLGVLRGRLDRGRELLRSRLARRGIALSLAFLTVGVAGASEAGVLPNLMIPTVQAALGAAPSSAAAGAVSAQAAALAQGVIHAMFITKLKVVATTLLVLAFVGTGAGVVTYHAQAQAPAADPFVPKAPQGLVQPPAADPAPAKEMTPAQMKREIQRLRLELEQARALLNLANQEILDLRAKMERGKREKVLPPLAPPGKTGQAISPDQKSTATSQGKSVVLWDVETGKELRRFMGHADTVESLAISPDGRRLASGSRDKSVILWDMASGKMLAKIAVQHPIVILQFAPDAGKLLIRNIDQSTLIDVPTGKILRVQKMEPPE